MIARISSISESNLHKIQQAVKWIVYALLIINWGFYIYEDWNRAVHTLNDGSTVFDWAREFATSIDESAWFIILFMFELQTYVLEDQDWKGWGLENRARHSFGLLRDDHAHRVRVRPHGHRLPTYGHRRECVEPLRHD